MEFDELVEYALRDKVRQIMHSMFSDALDVLLAARCLRDIGEHTEKYVHIDKITEVLNAQFVILEIMLEAIKPSDDADLDDCEESNASMRNLLELAKQEIFNDRSS